MPTRITHNPDRCTIPDCPLCERIAEDRADPPLDNWADNESLDRAAGDRYERHLWENS